MRLGGFLGAIFAACLYHCCTMNVLAYNGAAIMAMKGKDCVAIAADRRFGIQAQTVSTDFDKIFKMGPQLYIGLAGLATDVQTVAQRLKFRLNLYELRENRKIKPKTFMSMMSNMLYERRFGPYFVEPVIAGLNPKTYEPYIASVDPIGCPMETEDFVVSGTCTEQMYGMCESLWEPDLVSVHDSNTLFRPQLNSKNLNTTITLPVTRIRQAAKWLQATCLQGPDDLFETISQALVNAFDRDAVSGWGAVVHIIEKDKVTKKMLKTRQD